MTFKKILSRCTFLFLLEILPTMIPQASLTLGVFLPHLNAQTPQKSDQKILELSKKKLAASPSTLRLFKLKDGNQILGELKKFENGEYQVKTGSLGLIKISGDDLMEITLPKASPPQYSKPLSPYNDNSANRPPGQKNPVAQPKKGNNPFSSDQINQFMTRITSDPVLLQKVMDLANNPQIQGILSDQNIMELINTGQYQELLNNPQLESLMQDPDIKGILEGFNK